MRPEHSETKTETRECKTQINTYTEIKNLLWDRDQKTTRPRPKPVVQSIACEVCFIFLLHTWGEWWTGNGFCI